MPNLNIHNQQYQKNERKILQGYLDELKRVGAYGTISLSDISKISGVPYRTVLGHYRNFSELERSNVEEILRIVYELVDECCPAGDDYRIFLKKFLLTVSRESIRFQIEHNRKNFAIWEQILLYSKDILTKKWSSYGSEINHEIFVRFCGKFLGEIYLWSETDFAISNVETCLTPLIRLTEHATKHEKT